MSKQWLREHKKDHFYRQAKQDGYRSRAAFKLKQIHTRFKIIRKGDRVIDLGASPGGWSQVALELVGPTGSVVAVDLVRMEAIEGVSFVAGDMTSKDTVDRVLSLIDRADVVISDMSPKLSGNYTMDQARSVYLVSHALDFAHTVLRPGGSFVAKVFEGEDFPGLRDSIRTRFRRFKLFSPEASRNSSSEIYVVAMGFTGKTDRKDADAVEGPTVPDRGDDPGSWI